MLLFYWLLSRNAAGCFQSILFRSCFKAEQPLSRRCLKARAKPNSTRKEPFMATQPNNMGTLKNNHRILIADRNPHVRGFLKRELAVEGYQVSIAASGAEVIRIAYSDNCLDVIILDPDLPGVLDSSLLQTLRSRVPAVPVILHGLSQDLKTATQLSGGEIFVEKRANSIEHLKKIVQRIIRSNGC